MPNIGGIRDSRVEAQAKALEAMDGFFLVGTEARARHGLLGLTGS